jgi:hypothetical protein
MASTYIRFSRALCVLLDAPRYTVAHEESAPLVLPWPQKSAGLAPPSPFTMPVPAPHSPSSEENVVPWLSKRLSMLPAVEENRHVPDSTCDDPP